MNVPRAAYFALFVAVAVILVVTLVPVDTPTTVPPPDRPVTLLFPVADVVRNWLLFLPLGAVLLACGCTAGGRSLSSGPLDRHRDPPVCNPRPRVCDQ
jgi:hypothetical protein